MRHLWLCALPALLLASCSSGDRSLRTVASGVSGQAVAIVDEHVKDPARAEKAKAPLRALVGSLEGFYVDLSQRRNQLFRIASNYRTPKDRFEEQYRQMAENRASRRETMIDLWLEARAAMTPEEWKSFNTALRDELGLGEN